MKKTLALTLILTTVLSLVIMTAVKTNSTSTYDPWADLNDDGKINMKDIAATAILFGTTGDPTKNVTVTNWPQTPAYKLAIITLNTSIPFDYWYATIGLNDFGGYSKLYWQLNITDWGPKTGSGFSIELDNFSYTIVPKEAFPVTGNWHSYYLEGRDSWSTVWQRNQTQPAASNVSDPVALDGRYVTWIELQFHALGPDNPQGWALIDVYMYARND